MRRMRFLGVAIFAAIAFGAITASGAQAGVVGLCVKAPKEGKHYVGAFTDKLCTKEATKTEFEEGKHNKYTFEEAKEVPYTSIGGPAALKGALGTISCESNTDVGKFINGRMGEDMFTFHGCTLSTTGGKCGTAGVIVTNTLTTHLIDHGEKGDSGKEPAEKEAWVDLEGTEGKPLAEFECEPGIKIKVTGSVSGKIGPLDVQTKAGKEGKKPKYSFELEFKAGVAEQDLIAEGCGALVKELTGMECVSAPSAQEGSGGMLLKEKKYEII